MSILRSALLGILLSSSLAAVASGQGARGAWEGVHTFRGQPTRVTITLDSVTSWRGTLAAPGLPGGVVPLDSVEVRGDSVWLRVPKSASSALLRGVLTADRSRPEGRSFIQGDTGVFRLVRPGTPALARLIADEELDLRPPRKTQGRPPQSNPDSARLVTSDIDLFWSVVERAPADSLAAYLRRDYRDAGSAGVEDFIRGRILNSKALAYEFLRNRARYDAARTSSPNGLLIGAEMVRDIAGLPTLVTHELIHFQQSETPNQTLLAHSFVEGTADFIAELITRGNINSDKDKYGYEHEGELWAEFSKQMRGTSLGDWMYSRPASGRPSDLGYFI